MKLVILIDPVLAVADFLNGSYSGGCRATVGDSGGRLEGAQRDCTLEKAGKNK